MSFKAWLKNIPETSGFQAFSQSIQNTGVKINLWSTNVVDGSGAARGETDVWTKYPAAFCCCL